MEREKIIEEMACKIERIFIEESRKEENKMYPWQDLPVFHSICLRIAKSILPDGARVLTKEELVKTMESGYVYDTTSGDKINLIEMAREIERKETASKIFSAIDKYSDKCFETVDNGVNCEPYQTFNYYKFFKWIVKFAKRFGVEV